MSAALESVPGRERIEAPAIAALLLAKNTVATELGVHLELSEHSHLANTDIDTKTMLSVVGNLVDNAIDSAALGPVPANVSCA